MFGRIRPPSSSPESLERPSSKLIKDDPLSIYEATLAKLRQGSKLDLIRHSDSESSETETTKSQTNPEISSQDVMLIDADFLPANSHRNSSDCESVCSRNQEKSRTYSVISMFAKYRNSHHTESSTKDDMETEDVSCLTDSQSCSDIRSLSQPELPVEEESSREFEDCQI